MQQYLVAMQFKRQEPHPRWPHLNEPFIEIETVDACHHEHAVEKLAGRFAHCNVLRVFEVIETGDSPDSDKPIPDWHQSYTTER